MPAAARGKFFFSMSLQISRINVRTLFVATVRDGPGSYNYRSPLNKLLRALFMKDLTLMTKQHHHEARITVHTGTSDSHESCVEHGLAEKRSPYRTL